MANPGAIATEEDIIPETMPEWLNSLKHAIKFPRKEELSRLANFILIDVRLIFIIVSVYITISSAITTTANNEAANDTSGNRTFNVTARAEHKNLQVAHVSNSVLWNCREKSLTNQYYKVLYGLLFAAFVLILLVFIVTRLSVLCGNITQELTILKQALWRIQLIKDLRKRMRKHEKGLDALFNWFDEQWDRDHRKNTEGDTKHHRKRKVSSIHCSVLIIPFFEALFLIVALPFMLTTYDINPIGCLVGPDEDTIEYNNVTGKVTLQFADSVLNYQVAALTISVVLMVPLASFAVMLPVQYYRITKRMAKKISEDEETYAIT